MRFTGLDTWRGICAVMVVLYHAMFYSHIYYFSFVRHSWLFVDFFFVLSGFVISYTYMDRLNDRAQAVTFMIRRFGRLYPLHLFMLLVVLGYELSRLAAVKFLGLHPGIPLFQSPARGLDSLVTNIFLIHSFNIHSGPTWNVPSWSISAEFYVYILFMLAIVSFRHWLKYILLVAIIISITGILRMSEHFMSANYDYGMIRCIFGFSVGVFVKEIRFSDIAARFERFVIKQRHVASLIEIAFVIAVAWFVAWVGQTPVSVLAPFLFALAILVFSFECGMISTFLKGKSMVLLGHLSYSIYMTHMVIVFVAGAVLGKLLHSSSEIGGTSLRGDNLWLGDAIVLGVVAVTLAVSYLTYHWLEVPYRRKFNGIAKNYLTRNERRQSTEAGQGGAVAAVAAGAGEAPQASPLMSKTS